MYKHLAGLTTKTGYLVIYIFFFSSRKNGRHGKGKVSALCLGN